MFTVLYYIITLGLSEELKVHGRGVAVLVRERGLDPIINCCYH